MSNEQINVRVAVVASNASGEPDIFVADFISNADDVECGKHYETANEMAMDNGYEPSLAIDINDPAAKFLPKIFADQNFVFDNVSGLVLTPQSLLESLEQTGKVKIDGWSIYKSESKFGPFIETVDPYGVPGMRSSMSIKDCESVLLSVQASNVEDEQLRNLN